MYFYIAVIVAASYGLYLFHDGAYESGRAIEKTVRQQKENTEIKELNAQIVDLQDKGVKDRKIANTRSTRIAKSLTGELGDVRKERDAARAAFDSDGYQLYLYEASAGSTGSDNGEEGTTSVTRRLVDPEGVELSRTDLKEIGQLRQELRRDLVEIGYAAKETAIQLRATQQQLQADRLP